jgi:hypothetical protein
MHKKYKCEHCKLQVKTFRDVLPDRKISNLSRHKTLKEIDIPKPYIHEGMLLSLLIRKLVVLKLILI